MHFELIFVYNARARLHCFACGDPVVPAPLVEETVLSPLNGLGSTVENLLTSDVCIYFSQFYFIDFRVYPYANTTPF